jgi:hypothetical protein
MAKNIQGYHLLLLHQYQINFYFIPSFGINPKEIFYFLINNNLVFLLK